MAALAEKTDPAKFMPHDQGSDLVVVWRKTPSLAGNADGSGDGFNAEL